MGLVGMDNKGGIKQDQSLGHDSSRFASRRFFQQLNSHLHMDYTWCFNQSNGFQSSLDRHHSLISSSGLAALGGRDADPPEQQVIIHFKSQL